MKSGRLREVVARRELTNGFVHFVSNEVVLASGQVVKTGSVIN